MTHLHPYRSDDDQIFQKYLDRAISEINGLGQRIAGCELCTHDDDFAPVLGTGHPLADVFLLKYRPQPSELAEGVAFFGRSGEAVLASVRRLQVDPLDLYGTNCIKCTGTPDECVAERCPSWLRDELRIVSPKLVIAMGRESLDVLNGLELEGADELRANPARLQQWTHACEVLWCPDIDESLHAPAAKQAFWDSFRELGHWYAARPPW